MSSIYVRDQFKNLIAAELPGEKLVDLTARYEEIKELLEVEGVASDSPWLGIEFIGGEEIPVGLAATNSQGKYRESGAVQFHVVDIARLGNGPTLLTRGKAIMDILRGERLGDIIIETMSLMNFGTGSTLHFDGGYVSGTFLVSFIRDLDL